MAEIRNRVWLKDAKPLEGTAKNPQGRLFSPTGQFSGDPFKLAPENWMKQSDTPAHDDIIAWHGSEESQLPREDEYENRAWEPGHGVGPDWGDDDDVGDDYSVDSQERPMGGYGSAVGMHFGNSEAANSRGGRPFLHPVRIPKAGVVNAPPGTYRTPLPGGMASFGPYRSDHEEYDPETKTGIPDTRWSDEAANFSERATDEVEMGAVVPYRNDVEAQGSTSYRALPDVVRTWGEDVSAARDPMTGRPASEKYGWSDSQAFRNRPHPGLVAAAEAGYNPVTQPGKTGENRVFTSTGPYRAEPTQPQLPFRTGEEGRMGPITMENDIRAEEGYAHNKASTERREAFDAGRLWSMQKPRSVG